MHGEHFMKRQRLGIFPTREFWLRQTRTSEVSRWMAFTTGSAVAVAVVMSAILRPSGLPFLLRSVVVGVGGYLYAMLSLGLYERRQRQRPRV